MKSFLKILFTFTFFLVISCDSDDSFIDESTSISNFEINDVKSPIANKLAPPNSTSPSNLTYIGNSRWEGYWGGVKLRFRGCSPENLDSNLICYWNLEYAEGLGVLNYEGGVTGSVTIPSWGIVTKTFQKTEYYFIGDHKTTIISDFTLTFHTNGTLKFPYKIIFIAKRPILIHPDYSVQEII